LEIDWTEDFPLPDTIAVSMPVKVKVSMNISMNTMRDLEAQGLLSQANPTMTAAERWATCAVAAGACKSADRETCCYWHVNVHSCLDKPGTFCGPWVGNDGHLATHTPAQALTGGIDGRSVFEFDIKLFNRTCQVCEHALRDREDIQRGLRQLALRQSVGAQPSRRLRGLPRRDTASVARHSEGREAAH
jgi:hypothetical protein